jgi:hypothetical protein
VRDNYRCVGNGKKAQVRCRTSHEGSEGEYKYSSALSLTSALDGVGGLRHAPAALPPGKRLVTHCTGGCVGSVVGLDGCGKSRLHQASIPDRPASSESLYQLRYPGCCVGWNLQFHVRSGNVVNHSQNFVSGPSVIIVVNRRPNLGIPHPTGRFASCQECTHLNGCVLLLQAILRDSVVSVEIEVKPHNLVPDTNCFIDYLSQLQIIAQAGPAQQHYYTLMVPLVGK